MKVVIGLLVLDRRGTTPVNHTSADRRFTGFGAIPLTDVQPYGHRVVPETQGPADMRHDQKDLEDALSMAELWLACLLVDYRDYPDMQRILKRQREALVVLRQRVDEKKARGLDTRLVLQVKTVASRLVGASAPGTPRAA
jgi:hypothetical protein